jgi:hypothetical protein
LGLMGSHVIVNSWIGEVDALGEVEKIDRRQPLDCLTVIGKHAVVGERVQGPQKGVRSSTVINNVHSFAVGDPTDLFGEMRSSINDHMIGSGRACKVRFVEGGPQNRWGYVPFRSMSD